MANFSKSIIRYDQEQLQQEVVEREALIESIKKRVAQPNDDNINQVPVLQQVGWEPISLHLVSDRESVDGLLATVDW